MNKYFNPADWIVIFTYLGGIIALGMWFGKDQRNTRDYFLGSRNIPWWGIGFSIVAAETSALTIIGVPALAYGSNIVFIQMIIGYVIARLILAVVTIGLAQVLNGIAIVQAYFLLFTGKQYVSSVSLKIRVRERYAVLALAALILIGGLIPQPNIAYRHKAALELQRETRHQPEEPLKPAGGGKKAAVKTPAR